MAMQHIHVRVRVDEQILPVAQKEVELSDARKAPDQGPYRFDHATAEGTGFVAAASNRFEKETEREFGVCLSDGQEPASERVESSRTPSSLPL